jgi:hypothetical protein
MNRQSRVYLLIGCHNTSWSSQDLYTTAHQSRKSALPEPGIELIPPSWAIQGWGFMNEFSQTPQAFQRLLLIQLQAPPAMILLKPGFVGSGFRSRLQCCAPRGSCTPGAANHASPRATDGKSQHVAPGLPSRPGFFHVTGLSPVERLAQQSSKPRWATEAARWRYPIRDKKKGRPRTFLDEKGVVLPVFYCGWQPQGTAHFCQCLHPARRSWAKSICQIDQPEEVGGRLKSRPP